MLDDLFEFLQGAVTPYHAAAIAAAWLDAAGYTRLEEADYWNLEAGKGYYITRNGSSVIAWRVPEHAIGGWRIAASHSDSPCWKIKNEKVENDGCSRLSVEGYGGMIMSTWLDRPLTVAGRVMVKTEDGIESRLVNIDEDLLVIPSLAIHMQRNVNNGKEFNPQIDMQPLWGPAGCRTLTDVLCEELNVPYVVEECDLIHQLFDVRREENPCALCARLRRGALLRMAAEQGCSKLALGHHREDAEETLLMSVLYEARLHTFHPVTHMEDSGVTVIRPMVYAPEREIIHLAKKYAVPVVKNPCPADGHTTRQEMKDMLEELSRRLA